MSSCECPMFLEFPSYKGEVHNKFATGLLFIATKGYEAKVNLFKVLVSSNVF